MRVLKRGVKYRLKKRYFQKGKKQTLLFYPEVDGTTEIEVLYALIDRVIYMHYVNPHEGDLPVIRKLELALSHLINKESDNMFKPYRRTQKAELRPVTIEDIETFRNTGIIPAHTTPDNSIEVSISAEDKKNGSPKKGDMIARNPENHLDQWLVAEEYFKKNFES